MKYFFLAEGWTVGRIWELGGLWNEVAWRRPPYIERMNLFMQEQEQEKLWLYAVEDAVLMVEVKPDTTHASGNANRTIGQVVLKRLISAEQALELMCSSSVRQVGLEQDLSAQPNSMGEENSSQPVAPNPANPDL